MKKRGFTLIEMMVTVAVLAIIAIVAIPGYQNYVIKSQVGEGFSVLSGSKLDYEDFYNTYGKAPTNEDLFHNKNINTQFLSNLEIDGNNIRADFGNNARPEIVGKNIKFTPNINQDDKKNLVWNCESNIESKYLPTICVANNNDNGGESNHVRHDYNILYWENGVMYVRIGSDSDGNPKYEAYDRYIYSHTDSDGVVHINYDYDPNRKGYIYQDGTFVETGTFYEGADFKNINYSKKQGGGKIMEYSEVNQRQANVGITGDNINVGKLPHITEGLNKDALSGNYGTSWEGSDVWNSLKESTSEMANAYNNPHHYLNEKGEEAVQNYKRDLQAFKDQVDIVKAANGGRIPDDFPAIYKEIYSKY